jgi:cyclophilin family peptidyl-prolyl cis-trans isomerase
MARAGLDAVRYQEYSNMHPHAKYTIGYAGRPRSGPEFYVNLADNTLDHGTAEEREFKMGPRRHAAWAASEAAEGTVDEPYPCFGRVISGFDVVDEIAGGTTWARLPKGGEDEGEGGEVRRRRRLDDNILVRPVRIVAVAILEDYDPKGSVGSSSGEEESGDTNDEL